MVIGIYNYALERIMVSIITQNSQIKVSGIKLELYLHHRRIMNQ